MPTAEQGSGQDGAVRLAQTGSVTLAYEIMGDPNDPVVVLVMGLGMQMIAWDDDLCAQFVQRGFRVLRFDNRDTGQSTHLSQGPQPSRVQMLLGRTSSAPYRLEDMADDLAGLLDTLKIEAAHIVGVSMGGMIAQTMAIRHPERVHSLTSIMSTTAPQVGRPTRRAQAALLQRPARTAEEAADRSVRVFRVIGSPGFPFDEKRLRERARAAFHRADDPQGVLRQLAAIGASGERATALRELDVPSLVVHGDADPLVRVAGGRATASALRRSRLVVVPGMGHDLPREVWPTVLDGVRQMADHPDTWPQTPANRD